jgi:hypothetical protein
MSEPSWLLAVETMDEKHETGGNNFFTLSAK